MNLIHHRKYITPITLTLLVTLLAVFALSAFPAKAQDLSCTTVPDCAAQAATYADRAERIANNFLIEYSASISEDDRREINLSVTHARNKADLAKDAGSVEEARNLVSGAYLAAKEIADRIYQITGNIIEEGKDKPWWYYLVHIGEGALVVIGAGLNLILQLLSELIRLVANMVRPILTWPDFAEAAVVTTGWTIARNVANLFFALILLIIAFATILRIETYGMKALLPKFVIVALLINFSLIIATPFLGFSGVLTNYFVDAAKPKDQTLSEGLAQYSNIVTIYMQKSDIAPLKGIDALSAMVLGQIGGIFYAITTIFVFAALVILLIIRVVFIWFLLILAPIAWLLWIVPNTRYLFTKWWKNFLKWTFFAPIFAFFLYLALSSRQALMESIGTEMASDYPGTIFAKVFSAKILMQLAITYGLLVGGLIAAQKLGIYGASGLIKFGRGANKTVGGAIDKWLAKGAEKKGKGIGAATAWLRRRAAYLSPTSWKKAWEARKKEKERAAYPVAVGARQDFLNRLLNWKTLYKPGVTLKRLWKERRLGAGEVTDYEERAKRARIKEERKDIVTTSAEEQIKNFKDAGQAGEGFKMAANAQASAEQGDLNELFNSYKDPEMTFSPEGLKHFADTILKPVMGEQDAYRLSHDLGKTLETMGQWEIGRGFKYDAEKKIWKAASTPEEFKQAKKESYAQWNKQEPQYQARMTHRLGYIEEGWDPEVIDPETGKKVGGVRDLGIPLSGQLRIRALDPTEAKRRMMNEPMVTLMTKHAGEVEKLNPGLYELLHEKIKAMDPKQIEELTKAVRPLREGMPTSSWKNVLPRKKRGMTLEQGAGI